MMFVVPYGVYSICGVYGALVPRCLWWSMVPMVSVVVYGALVPWCLGVCGGLWCLWCLW